MPKAYWKKHFFIITAHPFRCEIAVAINMTGPEVYRQVKKVTTDAATRKDALGVLVQWEKDTTTGNAQGAFAHMGKGYIALLSLKKGKWVTALGTIVHEMTHVTQWVLRERRVPLTEDTEEVHAYLVEDLVQQVVRRF